MKLLVMTSVFSLAWLVMLWNVCEFAALLIVLLLWSFVFSLHFSFLFCVVVHVHIKTK